MKNIFIYLFLFVSVFAIQAQEIKWLSLNEALTKQKKAPKPIFIDVYTTWCGPCKLLDANTFKNPEVAQYISANFYPVKFNAEGIENVTYKNIKYSNPGFDSNRTGRNSAHEFTKFLKVTGYPSMYIISKTGEIEPPIVGYYIPDQLLLILKEQK